MPDEIDYEALPEDSPLVAQLAAGAFAGIMEHATLYPIDVIKTRTQLYLTLGNIRDIASRGIVDSIVRVTLVEGLAALWKGVLSVILGAGPAHAVYFGVFEHTKTTLVNYFTNQKNSRFFITDEKHPVIASVSGVAATTASDALMTPFDVLKQRMQTLKSLRQEKIGISSTARTIVANEGLGALWVLYPATLLMNIPFAAINFGIYEYASLIMNPNHNYNPAIHCLAGGLSGACAAAITNPLDVVKTFLQTKGLSHDEKIRRVSSRWWLVVKFLMRSENGGWRNFLKGLKPRVIFNVPSTAISWTAYEMAKSYLC